MHARVCGRLTICQFMEFQSPTQISLGQNILPQPQRSESAQTGGTASLIVNLAPDVCDECCLLIPPPFAEFSQCAAEKINHVACKVETRLRLYIIIFFSLQFRVVSFASS